MEAKNLIAVRICFYHKIQNDRAGFYSNDSLIGGNVVSYAPEGRGPFMYLTTLKVKLTVTLRTALLLMRLKINYV